MSDNRDDGQTPRYDFGEISTSEIACAVPRAESRFEPVRDRYGLRLALVFGNHAPGGLCPFYAAERCFHCDIGAGEGLAFDHGANLERLAWFRGHYQPYLASISHLVLYNSGSVLNPREMPPELLVEIIRFARSLPAVRVISLDSREAFIKSDTLRRILSILGDGLILRPILGIESADDRIRNEFLQKAMPRAAIARVFRDMGTLAAEFGRTRIGVDVNIVIAPPGTTGETAVADAVMTAQYALTSGAEHGLTVDLNLHPYYVGSRGSAHFPGQPRCPLATTACAASKIVELVRSLAADSSIFIGWHDEGHDREGEQRTGEMKIARAAFDRFNHTNDLGALDCLGSATGIEQ